MRIIHCAVVIAAVVASSCANAQHSDRTVKIGILTDMSGIYSEIGGPGSVLAAKLAVEDFRPAAKGMKVEMVSGDMQNKPEWASALLIPGSMWTRSMLSSTA
jgi:branched-chain amino acid transport system substrate-binding protein